LADNFLSRDGLDQPETWYPLNVCICRDCSLIQLGYVVPPEKMYHAEYPYVTSVTKAGVTHFNAMGLELYREFGLEPKDLVAEIGSNAGVLLRGFQNAGSANVLGIEPVGPIARMANRNGVRTMNAFFDARSAAAVLKKYGRAKIVAGTNVIAHIDDHHMLARSVRNLLDRKGVFVFDAPYWGDLLDNLEYDTIYHEHLAYLSVKPVKRLCGQFGLELFDVRHVAIHGGTLRYFIGRKGEHPVRPSVARMLGEEKRRGLYDLKRLRTFAADVAKHRDALVSLLVGLKAKGKTIAGLSAPAKGMTLLNYCRIGTSLLDFVTEKSPLKIGRYTPGMRIPVVSDAELVRKMPDYALILAWNFSKEIMKNLKAYADKGGRFIIPVPTPKIVKGG
jgi:hypothetical protein